MLLNYKRLALKHRLGIRIFTFLAFCSFLSSAPGMAADVVEGLAPGTAAPNFRLPVVNKQAADDFGKWFGPAKWVGKKPKDPKKLTVVSFFATYCIPCRKEMPEMVRLYNEYKDQGMGAMLVSIDKTLEKRDEVAQLAIENKVNFPVLHDRFGVVGRRYKAERLPYMLFIDREGTIQKVHIGYTEEMKAQLENEVRAGLGLEALAAEKEPVAEKEVKKKKKSKKKKSKKPKKS